MKRLFEINNSEIAYYKVDSHDDPSKRITKSKFNFKVFEAATDDYKVVVKLVGSRLTRGNGFPGFRKAEVLDLHPIGRKLPQ